MKDDTAAERLFAFRWDENITQNERGEPRLAPMFVAEHCAGIQLIDLRVPAQALASTGFIPGSVFADTSVLDSFVSEDTNIKLVLVSERGDGASELALRLHRGGVERVAALSGGIAGWRNLGLGTSRDADALRREFTREQPRAPSKESLTVQDISNTLVITV